MTDQRKTRSPVFQDYYTEDDYKQVVENLPDIVKAAQRQAAESLEPTIYEKKEVMKVIREYISKKKRKVYGGTAINELIKAVNPADAIYDDYTMSDIEFYSPTPVMDIVELCNILHDKGYPYVKAREAQHQETYTIFVNFVVYCDVTYVPTRVYNGIKPIVVDGIIYVDPHFILIDRFRMFTDPMNSAWRWEKQFERMYKLLKYYPLEHFDKHISIEAPSKENTDYLLRIKNDFLAIKEVQRACMINGFEAYNFYVKHAARDPNVEKMARTTYGANPYEKLTCNVPFLEFVSVNYVDTVERLYNFIRDMVQDRSAVTIEEYFPLFQFTEYSTTISYQGKPLVKVAEADGRCIPNVKTTRGYMYVSYQFLLMTMYINKFRAHLDQDKNMYYNYSIASSNLIKARNSYLMENNLTVINNSIFGEFKVSCVGTTVSFMRMAQLRRTELYKKGKLAIYSYDPETFKSKEERDNYIPRKPNYRNTAGNQITNPKNLIFKLDTLGNIIAASENPDDFDENDTDSPHVSESGTETPSTHDNVDSSDGGNVPDSVGQALQHYELLTSPEFDNLIS